MPWFFKSGKSRDDEGFSIPKRYGSEWDAWKNYLEILRRESANYLLDKNVDLFENLFFELYHYESEMEKSEIDRARVEHLLLMKKYQSFEDFDLIGVRHFVRYDEIDDIEVVVKQYTDTSKFLITNRIVQNAGSKYTDQLRVYGENEVKIFREKIAQYRDNLLTIEIKRVVEIFDDIRSRLDEIEDDHPDLSDLMIDYKQSYENCEFRISSIPCEPWETFAYGIHLKKQELYCIKVVTVRDGGMTQLAENFYRSDFNFVDRKTLRRY